MKKKKRKPKSKFKVGDHVYYKGLATNNKPLHGRIIEIFDGGLSVECATIKDFPQEGDSGRWKIGSTWNVPTHTLHPGDLLLNQELFKKLLGVKDES